MRRLRTLLIVPALQALLLVPVLLAFLAGGTLASSVAGAAGAPAQGAEQEPGLDPSFGSGGSTTVEVPPGDGYYGEFKVTPDGRVYVLAGSSLLAFRSDGTVDTEFGESGRITIAPSFVAAGESEGEAGPSDLALDSQGRLLIVGSAPLPGQEFPLPPNQKIEEAYVIRFLPDGNRDPSFGTNGEVDTTFGLPAKAGTAPSVGAGSIAVDAEDRPVIGGAFGPDKDKCGLGFNEGPSPFVARLTATGALDPTFARGGHTTFGRYGGVTGLTPIPGGGFAVFSRACATPPRLEPSSPEYDVIREDGERSTTVRQVSLPYTYTAPLIDSRRRLVELNSVPPAAEGVDAVARCLPNGEPDPTFGHKGRAILRHKPHYAEAIAVDAKSRPIIALSAKRIVLRRYLANGKVDRRFGPNGKLPAAGRVPSAIALDGAGRIYTLSVSHDSTRGTVAIARFIPGP